MQLTTAIEGFLLSLRIRHYSPVTADNYALILARFSKHAGDIELHQVANTQCSAYLLQIQQHGSMATVQYHWKVLRSFFKWCAAELAFPAPDLGPAPKFVTAQITPLTQDQIKKLLKACKSKRSRALILALLDTGLRASELCRLLVADVDVNTGAIRTSAFSTGAKSRPRTVYLGALARSELWKYLAFRKAGKDEPLFTTLRGKQALNRTSLAHILRRLGDAAGVPGVHPHQFRHTFAIEYLRSGGDVFSLRLLLGHSSLEMTRRYLNLAQADLEHAHRKHSPVDRWL